MRLCRTSLALAILAIAPMTAVSQLTLQTLTTGTNANKGTMFDLINISTGPVVITGFDQVFSNVGVATYEIYARTGGGGYSGVENTAAAWTLIGSTVGLGHSAGGTLTAIPVTLGLSIPAGATQGFYLTATSASGSNVAYTSGVSQLNTIFTQNAQLQFRVGVGKAYPFGASAGLPTAGRIWNGVIRYTASGLFSDFSATPTTQNAPASISFTDLSFSTAGPITSREWDFNNDGLIDSTATNPTNIYTTPGVYSVSLRVQDGVNPAATRVRTNYITINPELFRLTTTGVGDLTMSGPDDPVGTTEGFLFLSSTITGAAGSGSFLGINFDDLTYLTLTWPISACGVFHYIPTPGCFPNVDLVFGPGSIPVTGTTYDGVLVRIGSFGFQASNVARVTL